MKKGPKTKGTGPEVRAVGAENSLNSTESGTLVQLEREVGGRSGACRSPRIFVRVAAASAHWPAEHLRVRGRCISSYVYMCMCVRAPISYPTQSPQSGFNRRQTSTKYTFGGGIYSDTSATI